MLGGPMAQQPPQPPKPGAPRKDTLESRGRNVFTGGQKFEFVPTPIKPRTQTGEMSRAGLRPVPVGRPPPSATRTSTLGAGGTTPSGSSSTNNATFMMPGMQMPGSRPTGARSESSPDIPAAKPGLPTSAKPAAEVPPPKPPPKPRGLITAEDKMAYKGKLPFCVGTAQDGSPMVDGEESNFSFDPTDRRVQLQCKVAAVMMKAACLHLGLPPPERGPRQYQLVAQMRPEAVSRHYQKLFDGNLEVRLQAFEDGHPALLNLTLYEDIKVLPGS